MYIYICLLIVIIHHSIIRVNPTPLRLTRELIPRVPTTYQGSKCVRRELKRRMYQVRARYQVRANPLLPGALPSRDGRAGSARRPQ